ncbi:MAG: TIGR01777 family oxidoreductase [Acidobacteria bacterium]|nr:TIGR01777 family oxidoreductase [Acidobacteriota bacterium]
MKITISGASGFIGRRLTVGLQAQGHSVHILSRRAGSGATAWNPLEGPPPAASLEGADAVVHLAGEPVAQRWTPEAKERIRGSRVTGTRNLVSGLARLERRPGVLISASAIGYYGARGDELLTEASPPGRGFLAGVCAEWEREAEAAGALGMRVVQLRIGIVLAAHGGALARMLPAFRLFAGASLGPGTQWMSWIHLDDLCGLIEHALVSPIRGPVNGASPNPVTNREFTRTLASALGRPAVFRIPAFALRAIFGEMAGVLLDSQRVFPEAARKAGFVFQYPEFPVALRKLLKS